MHEPIQNLSELDDTTEAFVGSYLLVEPFYGNGWRYGLVQAAAQVPSPFRAELLRLWFESGGLRRGGVARIKETGHPFDERFITFATHVVGCYNFTDRLGEYSALITDTEPVFATAARGPRPEWPLGPGDPEIRMNGWVFVAAPSAWQGTLYDQYLHQQRSMRPPPPP